MPGESRITVAALRNYYQEEIETAIRQMKIEGGTLDDCIAELKILADFVRSRADALGDAWPNLLNDTYYAIWEQRKNEIGAAGAPGCKSDQ